MARILGYWRDGWTDNGEDVFSIKEDENRVVTEIRVRDPLSDESKGEVYRTLRVVNPAHVSTYGEPLEFALNVEKLLRIFTCQDEANPIHLIESPEEAKARVIQRARDNGHDPVQYGVDEEGFGELEAFETLLKVVTDFELDRIEDRVQGMADDVSSRVNEIMRVQDATPDDEKYGPSAIFDVYTGNAASRLLRHVKSFSRAVYNEKRDRASRAVHEIDGVLGGMACYPVVFFGFLHKLCMDDRDTFLTLQAHVKRTIEDLSDDHPLRKKIS